MNVFKSKTKKKDEKTDSNSISVKSSIATPSRNISVSTTYTSHQQTKIEYRHSSVLATTTTSLFQNELFPRKRADTIPSLPASPRPLLSVHNDAVPFKASPELHKVNLNYQSPYRNSPVYRSYNEKLTNRPVNSPLATTPRPAAAAAVVAESVGVNSSLAKKLTVKKTGKFYDNTSSLVPAYKTSGKRRGEALIINNVIFKDSSSRVGAEVDERNICDLFGQMGFKVKSKRNLAKTTMEGAVRSFSHSSTLKNVDIAVVVVMSHGTNHALRGGYTEVFGVDDQGLDTDTILSYFTTEKCPSLANKPKIFVFQCCRGDNQDIIMTDSQVAKPRYYDDMLIAHSTLPGFASHRDPNKGTWYIQTICEVFSENAHEYDVESMLKIVDNKLATFRANVRQTSNYESRGFKKRCYFHP